MGLNKRTRVDVNHISSGRHCLLATLYSPYYSHSVLWCAVLYSPLLLYTTASSTTSTQLPLYYPLLPARQYSHVRTSQYVCSHRLPSGIQISFDIDDEQSTIKRSKIFLLLPSPCLLLLLPTIPQRTESGHEGNVNNEVCCENSKFWKLKPIWPNT